MAKRHAVELSSVSLVAPLHAELSLADLKGTD